MKHNKKEKTKFVNLKMEFNPGTQKYEPVLPLKKKKENVKKRIEWIDLIMIIIMIIIVGIIAAYLIINNIKP